MISTLSRKYKKRQQLGSGQFSSVFLCSRKRDGELFAMKITDKRRRDQSEIEALEQEIVILQRLRHPNIVDMVDILDTPTRTIMVLELCANGDVQSKMDQSPNGVLCEVDAAKITYILAKTLLFLHRNGVVHRDVKPQNILFTKSNVLKLTDFGMSHFVNLKHCEHRRHVMTTKCGTPYYAAPEIVGGRRYDEKVDCWSMGVLLYWMLSRVQPFECFQNLPMIYGRILSGKFSFDPVQFGHISVAAKDLISRLLTVRRRSRLDCEGVVDHLWTRTLSKVESFGVAMNELPDVDLETSMHRQSSLGPLVIDDYILEDSDDGSM